MRKIYLIALVVILVLILYACNLIATPTSTVTTLSGEIPAVGLTVQAQNAIFNTVGQTITYTYIVKNTGIPLLAGPVTVTDDKAIVTCAGVNTIGNLDNNLDSQESVTCASTYSITQADLNAGSVTSNATAKVGGTDSNNATTVVQMTENKVLALTYAANPVTYNQTGQTITFTYSIKNTGTPTLGPVQFVVKDDRLGAINCGAPTAVLGVNETMTCTAAYTISPNDIALNQLTFNATASGAGAGVNQPASITIANTNIVTAPGTPSANLTRGATIQHKVMEGEWMLQIARCYGADFKAVRNANLQVVDPGKIWPINTLTIPNIGSNGNIYGPPCIEYYTVQSGDTWNSIAQKHNADIAVLQEANPGVVLSNGIKVRVPRNSANGNPVPAPNDPIRLNFPSGSGSVTLSGNVSQSNKIRYVLNAAQGQTLNIKVTAPANEVALAVLGPNGTTLKAQDATLTWNGTIAANGDHFIEIVSVQTTTTKAYTLEVGLSALASAFERVADVNTGAADSNPAYLSVFNGTLYFKATGFDNTGAELWKYDLGLKAASRVADIFPGATGSEPAFLTPYNNALYFGANGNDGSGVELWRFNGNAPGRVGEINGGAGNANPAHMAVYNNLLYFSANGNDGTGVELWKTDGTTTSRVADIHPGTGDSNPAYLIVYNNILYFSATSNDGAGTELWKHDGTNTTRVLDINSGVGNSNPSYFAIFNSLLYFSANGNDATGTELWKYDGANASRVADINPGAGDSGPTFLTVFNGALYFGATGDGAGTELWKYDGANVKRVSDLNTTGNSNPAYLAVFDNALFFQANGGDGTGVELWKFKGP